MKTFKPKPECPICHKPGVYDGQYIDCPDPDCTIKMIDPETWFANVDEVEIRTNYHPFNNPVY